MCVCVCVCVCVCGWVGVKNEFTFYSQVDLDIFNVSPDAFVCLSFSMFKKKKDMKSKENDEK